MEELKRHEIFEIEALTEMNGAKLLEPLVFGGETMLRLCYELNRYSVDLDFWMMGKLDDRKYFSKVKAHLAKRYELTDSAIKRNTLLFEVRSRNYPKRLKIEVRREAGKCDFQEAIAFSKYGTGQVSLKAHTPEETMKRKIKAALDRKEIRDFFDIEFLLRKGIRPVCEKKELDSLKKLAMNFKKRDFQVTLGSILDGKDRKYYVENGFAFLERKIN